MALSSIAMTTVAKAKAHLRLNDSDAQVQANAIDIYHDQGSSATAATVEVTDTTVVLVITGGGNDGTDTLTLADANKDTISELVSHINDTVGKGWIATALYLGDADTGDLIVASATSAFGTAARQTLKIISNRTLELLINRVSKKMEIWFDRGIVSRSYSRVYHFDPANVREFSLGEPDVTAVTQLSLGTKAAMRVKYTGSDEVARIEVTDTGLTATSRTGSTTTTVASTTFSGNVSVSDLVTVINAASGWEATTDNDGPSAFLVREGVRNAKDREVTLDAWDDFGGDYIVDYDTGVITFSGLGWPFMLTSFTSTRRIFAVFTAGFATVPDDVDEAVVKAVATEWETAGRDETLQSESLEDYSYSLKSDLEPPWHKTLATYRRELP